MEATDTKGKQMNIVTWTGRDGTAHEWHYARRDEAEAVAAQLRQGWRKDARVR